MERISQGFLVAVSVLLVFAAAQTVQLSRLGRDTGDLLARAEREVAQREWLVEQRI